VQFVYSKDIWKEDIRSFDHVAFDVTLHCCKDQNFSKCFCNLREKYAVE